MLIYSTLNTLQICAKIRMSRVRKPSEQVVFAESLLHHTRPRAEQTSQFSVDNALVATLQIRSKVQPFYEQRVFCFG